MTMEVRAPLDAYLDAVDLSLLRAGVARPRRVAIVRDLESQVMDMMKERVAGPGGEAVGEGTVTDMAAILATLDPPEAYAGGETAVVAGGAKGVGRSLPKNLLWAWALLPVACVGLIILMVGGGELNRHMNGQMFLLLLIAGAPVMLMFALSCALGVAAFRQIQRNRARYWGLPLAMMVCVPFPLLFLAASPLLFLSAAFAGFLLFSVHRVYNLRQVGREVLMGE